MKQQEQLTQEQINEVVALLDAGQVLDADYQEKIGNGFSEMTQFIAANTSNIATGDSTVLKELNDEITRQWNESRKVIENTAYNINLNEDESKFIKNLLETAEFSSPDELFVAEEVNEILSTQHPQVKYPFKAGETIQYKLNIRQVTNFYHVLTLHKAKGLFNKSTVVYSNLLKLTGQTSLIFSYFNNMSREFGQNVYNFSLGISQKEEALAEPAAAISDSTDSETVISGQESTEA